MKEPNRKGIDLENEHILINHRLNVDTKPDVDSIIGIDPRSLGTTTEKMAWMNRSASINLESEFNSQIMLVPKSNIIKVFRDKVTNNLVADISQFKIILPYLDVEDTHTSITRLVDLDELDNFNEKYKQISVNDQVSLIFNSGDLCHLLKEYRNVDNVPLTSSYYIGDEVKNYKFVVFDSLEAFVTNCDSSSFDLDSEEISLNVSDEFNKDIMVLLSSNYESSSILEHATERLTFDSSPKKKFTFNTSLSIAYFKFQHIDYFLNNKHKGFTKE